MLQISKWTKTRWLGIALEMLLTTQTGKSGIFEGSEQNFLLAEIGPEGVKNG
jgi:hypothetical protein